MIEAPSLLWHLDALLPMTDFVSVGTNDLMQYLFAADRGNPRVADRYDPLSPPALRALKPIQRRLRRDRHAGLGLRRDGRPAAGGLRPGRRWASSGCRCRRPASGRSSRWCCPATARPRGAGVTALLRSAADSVRNEIETLARKLLSQSSPLRPARLLALLSAHAPTRRRGLRGAGTYAGHDAVWTRGASVTQEIAAARSGASPSRSASTRPLRRSGRSLDTRVRHARRGAARRPREPWPRVDDIAQATRIRRRILAALEACGFDALPSRPFAIGYRARLRPGLGSTGEAASSASRAEAPLERAALRAPAGLRHQDGRRPGRWLALAAIAVWSSPWSAGTSPIAPMIDARRARRRRRSDRAAARRLAARPARLGRAAARRRRRPPRRRPTPRQASIPRPSARHRPRPQRRLRRRGPGARPRAAFQPAGPIYGAPAAALGVILQARKSTSLVVRGAGGAVYFARQLAAGEAWRAPPARPASPSRSPTRPSIEVFVDGRSKRRCSPQPASRSPTCGAEPRRRSPLAAVQTSGRARRVSAYRETS